MKPDSQNNLHCSNDYTKGQTLSSSAVKRLVYLLLLQKKSKDNDDYTALSTNSLKNTKKPFEEMDL